VKVGYSNRHLAYACNTSKSIHIKIKTNKEGKVNLSFFKECIFHELGHHLEFKSKSLCISSNVFLRLRTSEKRGNYYVNGNFRRGYTGKTYGHSMNAYTEVVTTGIEKFCTPRKMYNFLKTDLEHFNYILGIISNSHD
ncbi:MAG: hypothetical protein R3321_06280, partial [Nitrososphaeraceae archaeon]|nr:hypothetical protein [Nitrososphaeraceae archaeon]